MSSQENVGLELRRGAWEQSSPPLGGGRASQNPRWMPEPRAVPHRREGEQ